MAREPRTVQIRELTLLAVDLPEFDLQVHCSKGDLRARPWPQTSVRPWAVVRMSPHCGAPASALHRIPDVHHGCPGGRGATGNGGT